VPQHEPHRDVERDKAYLDEKRDALMALSDLLHEIISPPETSSDAAAQA